MKKTDSMIFIWDFFKAKGLSDYGIAGLMGNLYAESGLRSNTLERLCIKRYAEIGINFTDELYTISIHNGAISKEEFLHPMGKHYGYGLAQWTTESRKSGLYDYCFNQNVPIDSLQAQCEYLYLELEKAFKSTLNVLKTVSPVFFHKDSARKSMFFYRTILCERGIILPKVTVLGTHPVPVWHQGSAAGQTHSPYPAGRKPTRRQLHF